MPRSLPLLVLCLVLFLIGLHDFQRFNVVRAQEENKPVSWLRMTVDVTSEGDSSLITAMKNAHAKSKGHLESAGFMTNNVLIWYLTMSVKGCHITRWLILIGWSMCLS